MKNKLINWLKDNWTTIIALISSFVLGVLLPSCNVTRTITNEATSYKRGDTTVVITTKTTESYNATKFNN